MIEKEYDYNDGEVMIMDQPITIMVVEDDEVLAHEMKQFLMKWKYHAVIARSFDHILDEYMQYQPQLILLDVNLPYYDGFYWCHLIRNVSDVPIVYISSRQDDHDKIMGMAQGGDDYIEKPFCLELLKAKIDAILRRTYHYKVKEKVYFHQGLSFDRTSSALFYQDQEIELTKSERKIMNVFIDKRSQVVSREELMMVLWNTDEFVSDGTLTTLICRLRHKLHDMCQQDIILTKKGQGYYIE